MATRRLLALLTGLWGLTAILGAQAPAARSAKPNILFVLADDLGWKDVGYQGSDFYETPNLDRLAREGVVFTNAYAAGANCEPSRACLMSGEYTPRHQVYAVTSTDRGPKQAMRLKPVPNCDGLPARFYTMAEALQAAGYATGHFGKWHLAGPNGARPSQQGFDVTFDSFGEGPVREGAEGNHKGPPEDPKGVYTLTRHACEFMAANRHRPFFCYLAHHAIHGPQQGRPETLAKFQAKAPGAQHRDVMYAACTYDFDDSVGRLLQSLKDLGLEENTIVVFTSDNGGVQKSSQEPLRGSKGGYYEGGIREPFIVRWPGVTQPGRQCAVPVINVDLYPTFLAAAGAPLPPQTVLDGESLLPLLRGGTELKRQALFWHFPGYLNDPVVRGREVDVRGGFRSRPVTVIRKGDWKLHLFHEEWQLDGGREKIPGNHAVELYHLAEDVGERHDLAASHPQKRDELLNDLLAWIRSTGAILASEPNPQYDPHTKPTAAGKGARKRKAQQELPE